MFRRTHLIAVITDCPVTHVATRGKKIDGLLVQSDFGGNRCETMNGMMAMFSSYMTWNTEVVVFARCTSDKLGLFENWSERDFSDQVNKNQDYGIYLVHIDCRCGSYLC